MLCQNCHVNDASVHLRRIINGESAELHLCAACARALGCGNLFAGFSFPGAAGSLLEATDFSALGNRVLRCEVCGFSFDDIVRSTRPGCPNCYRVFYDKLSPMLQKIHGRAAFLGAPPAVPAGDTSGPAGEKWYQESGPHGDIVLGSAATLSANVDGLPFAVRLSPPQKNELNRRVLRALGGRAEKMRLVDPSRLYPYEAASLAERSLIPPEFVSAREGSLLAFTPDEKRCVMLCGEDHIRIRAAVSGLSPDAAFDIARDLRDAVNAALPLAVSPKLGFLNQSPLNLGTGFTPSVVMHLPALSASGALPALSSIASRMGVSLSGLGGTGPGAAGALLRVSNTLTMGLNEADSIANLTAFCLQLETKERAAAEELVTDVSVRDRVNRAASVLSGAVLLTSAEMNEMLSWVRLGTLYGLCKFDLPAINELFFTMQPASVNTLAGAKLTAPARDELRARLVREKLFPA